MRLLTQSEQQALDAFLIEKGIPLLILMESAGRALAKRVQKTFEREKLSSINLLVGPGMNGGDLYVTARILAQSGLPVKIFECHGNAKVIGIDPIHQMRGAAKALALPFFLLDDFSGMQARQTIVVDGLLGTGFQVERELGPELKHAFLELQQAREHGAYIIACDLPSGVDATLGHVSQFVIPAHETVTFIAPKAGQMSSPALSLNGKLHIDSIGIPEFLVEDFFAQYDTSQNLFPEGIHRLDESQFYEEINRLKSSAHKYEQGSLLLVGGSKGMAGSILLAAEAAARTGIGLLRIITAKEVYEDLFPILPSALYHIPETYNAANLIKEAIAVKDRVQAIAVGPGFGLGTDQEAFIAQALTWNHPLLLDADALTLLAQSSKLQKLFHARQANTLSTVLTPHEGEAKRLATQYMEEKQWKTLSRLEKAAFLSAKYQAHIVLKGEASLCVSPSHKKLYLNTTGGVGLAKGGSGDILSGIIGGFLAQKRQTLEACALGCYWHGWSGDLASSELHWRRHLPQDTISKL